MGSIIQPEGYKKPVMSVGDEFVAWAETYWRLEDKYIEVKDTPTGEAAKYQAIREIFIKKINDIITERFKHYL